MSTPAYYEQRPYTETYAVSLEKPLDADGVKPYRTVTIIFDSWAASEESEVDQFDDCREKVQQWLAKHYPGDQLATDGDDIERSGSPADNDDVIDMRTTA
jgi:hypothetical protein